MAKNTLYYGDNLQLLRNRDYFCPCQPPVEPA